MGVCLTIAEQQMLEVVVREEGGTAGYLGSQRWGGKPKDKARPAVLVLNRLTSKRLVAVERQRWGTCYRPTWQGRELLRVLNVKR